ncbi:forkhead box protein L2, partial [Histoplasma capsulatum]
MTRLVNRQTCGILCFSASALPLLCLCNSVFLSRLLRTSGPGCCDQPDRIWGYLASLPCSFQGCCCSNNSHIPASADQACPSHNPIPFSASNSTSPSPNSFPNRSPHPQHHHIRHFYASNLHPSAVLSFVGPAIAPFAMASTRQPPPLHIYQDIGPTSHLPPPSVTQPPNNQPVALNHPNRLQPSPMPLQPMRNASINKNFALNPPPHGQTNVSPVKSQRRPSMSASGGYHRDK